MGLRSQGSGAGVQSLKTMKQAVERGDALNRGVRHQGGRPRETVILDTGCQKALDNALAVQKAVVAD